MTQSGEPLAGRRIFVTGGAGFIGSALVDRLVAGGARVTVYDNLSLSTDQYIAEYLNPGFTYGNTNYPLWGLNQTMLCASKTK